jgi:hypothetical protein
MCGSICFDILSVTYRNHHFWDREAIRIPEDRKKELEVNTSSAKF